jgi:alpha-amylase
MGVMIHLAYKTSTGGGVPSPVDGKTITTWPLDEWRELMPYLRAFGVTVPVCPPLTKGATLGAGYDPFDHYDLGSKNQSGRVETRYGSIETAGRFFSACQAQGMEVYVNVVDHHMDGDSGDEVYQYLGADGKTKNGRFPKDSHCFTSVWPNPDGVADSSTDWAFGREFLWNSGYYGDGKGSNGPGYVRHGLAAALDWQTRRLNVDGYFLDDVKGTNEDFVGYLLTYGAMNGKVSFGEYSDGQTGNVERWINSSGVHRTCGALDFPLKYKLNNVLNNAGNADIRQILSEGLLWNDPLLSVTFLDDADSDLTSPIIWNKLLGYAMILTFPGYPMLFGKDLYQQPGCYGLMVPVMNLVWIHETFAKGNIVWRWLDYNFLVYERMGDNTSSGLLAGVNNKMGDFKNPSYRPL